MAFQFKGSEFGDEGNQVRPSPNRDHSFDCHFPAPNAASNTAAQFQLPINRGVPGQASQQHVAPPMGTGNPYNGAQGVESRGNAESGLQETSSPDYPPKKLFPDMIDWLDSLPDPGIREDPFKAMDKVLKSKRMDSINMDRRHGLDIESHKRVQVAEQTQDEEADGHRRKRARFSLHELIKHFEQNNRNQDQDQAQGQDQTQTPPQIKVDKPVLPQTPIDQIYHTEDYLYPPTMNDVVHQTPAVHHQPSLEQGWKHHEMKKLKRKFSETFQNVTRRIIGHGHEHASEQPKRTYPHEAVLKQGRMRFVFCGDTQSGKSALLQRHCRGWGVDRWSQHVPTSLEFYNCDVVVDGVTTHVESWDTAGTPRTDPLKGLMFLGVDLIVVCFGVENEANLLPVVGKWIPEAKRVYPNLPIFLVGTKTDRRINPLRASGDSFLSATPGVSSGQAERLANNLGCAGYLECSAVDNRGISNIFHAAVSGILQQRILEQRKKIEAEVRRNDRCAGFRLGL